MTPEEQARIVIDEKLEQSGWTIQDMKKLNLMASLGVAVCEFPTSTGPVDYALFIEGKPIGVVEAKKSEAGELMDIGAITIEDGYLSINSEIVLLLHELYYQEVICYHYSKKDILDHWIKDKSVKIGNTLFSKGETDYINYYLNQAEFSNGYDLRNKYIHDTCSSDERVQERDYYRLLKIMVLLVIKINEEFCLKDECIQFPFASS